MDPKEKEHGLDESNFWHKSKTKLTEILLSRFCNNKSDILIVGCGASGDLDLISKYGKSVVACDIDENALKAIKSKKIKKLKMDITDLKFPDQSFSIIIVLDVLEHIKEDAKAIKECYRVLKRDGCMIVTVPAFQFLFSSYDTSYGHVRRYSKSELLVKTKDFKVAYLGYWNSFLFPLFLVERIVKKRAEHKPHKPLPKSINNLLLKLLGIENYLISKGVRLPIGLTICGVFKK